MPLTFDWTEVQDFEKHLRDRFPDEGKGGKVPGPELETFILLMMPIGVSHEVTAANVGEFWARLDIMQRMFGAYITEAVEGKGRQDVFYTPEDIIAYIGLRTNCSTISRAAFLKNVVRAHMDEQVRACTGKQ